MWFSYVPRIWPFLGIPDFLFNECEIKGIRYTELFDFKLKNRYVTRGVLFYFQQLVFLDV